MKYAALQVAILVAVVAGLTALGQPAVTHRWGLDGVAALHAAALISLVAAVLAAVPLGLAATYWRSAAPQVAFAGTAVRLLVTGGLGLAYQAWADPQRVSFLSCLLAFYLVLLTVETAMIIFIVRRALAKPAPKIE
jgi:hypothetical protein